MVNVQIRKIDAHSDTQIRGTNLPLRKCQPAISSFITWIGNAIRYNNGRRFNDYLETKDHEGVVIIADTGGA